MKKKKRYVKYLMIYENDLGLFSTIQITQNCFYPVFNFFARLIDEGLKIDLNFYTRTNLMKFDVL